MHTVHCHCFQTNKKKGRFCSPFVDETKSSSTFVDHNIMHTVPLSTAQGRISHDMYSYECRHTRRPFSKKQTLSLSHTKYIGVGVGVIMFEIYLSVVGVGVVVAVVSTPRELVVFLEREKEHCCAITGFLAKMIFVTSRL